MNVDARIRAMRAPARLGAAVLALAIGAPSSAWPAWSCPAGLFGSPVAPGSHEALVVDAKRNQPNGITLSPDEKTLYLSSLDGLYTYAVAADGSVGKARRFASQVASADGMVADCAGNLYVTSTDVIVLSPSGRGVFKVDLDVPGLPY